LFAKNILIINSYSIKLLWTREELNGILKVLQDKPGLNVYIEFMDTKIFRPTPERLKAFYQYLKSKYSNIPIDVVIVTDDNALNFVREYKKTPLFKNTKVFFAGINNLSLRNVLDKNIYAGVFEKKEPLANLELLNKTVNYLKYVYVVSDNSTSGDSVMKEYKQAFKNIKKYKFIYINSKNLEDVLDRIKNAPENSGMLLLTPLSFYLNSHHINYKYAIALISEYFNHPIVIHSDLYVKLKNNNIIGGKVTDGFSQGYTVAQKVMEYLKGTPVNMLGFTFEKANKLYLNVKNLRKFGINAYSLGYKNAKYVNRPDTFYYRYRNWILTFFAVFFIIALIAIILFIKNRQLKKYNIVMKRLNESLEDKIIEAVNELKNNKNLSNEEMRKFIKNLIFQFKYPIEKLKDDSIEAQYLKEKIKELEGLIGEDKKEQVDLKKLLEDIKNETYSDKIEIKGKNLKLNIDSSKFKKIFYNLFDSIEKTIGYENVEKIIIMLTDEGIKIQTLHSNSFLQKDDILKKVFNSLYLSTVFLKYCINGDLEFNLDKNLLIYEIKLS
jgi:hypothetical protein